MQFTGELKRLNLIPIKKAVIDIKRGLILRTYYVNPNKFIEKITQQKLKKSAIYIGKLKEPLKEAIQLKNITKLKDYFPDEQSWSSIVKRNVELGSIDVQSSYHVNQLAGYHLLNFVTTLDKTHLTHFKRVSKKLGIKYQPDIQEKIKKGKRIKAKVKLKSRVTEQVSLTNDNVLLDALQYDNAEITRKVNLLSYRSTIEAGKIISKLINLYNPSSVKTVAIIERLLGSDFSDNSDIVKNIKLSIHQYLSNKQVFSSILSNLITEAERKLNQGDSINVDIDCLYYNYIILALLDKSTFISLSTTFNRDDIQKFLFSKGKFVDLYERYKGTQFEEPLILVYPDFTQVANFLASNTDKKHFLSLIGARSDVTPNILGNIYSILYPSDSLKQSLINWYRYITGQSESIDLNDVLYQIVGSKLIKVNYLPLTVLNNTEPIDSYFTFTPITKIAKIRDIVIPRVKVGISQLKQVNEIKQLYLPITKIYPNQSNIVYRLLPFQPLLLSDDIDISQYRNIVDLVPVPVSSYLIVEDNDGKEFAVITPHNILA